MQTIQGRKDSVFPKEMLEKFNMHMQKHDPLPRPQKLTQSRQ